MWTVPRMSGKRLWAVQILHRHEEIWRFRKKEKTLHFEEMHTMDDCRLEYTYLATQVMIRLSAIPIKLYKAAVLLYSHHHWHSCMRTREALSLLYM